MPYLSKAVSRSVVRAMSAALGRPAAASLLKVSTERFDVLSSGGGRLSYPQLDRIAAETKRPWQAWAIHDFHRRADTPAKRSSLDFFVKHQPKEIVSASGYRPTGAKQTAGPSKLRVHAKVSA